MIRAECLAKVRLSFTKIYTNLVLFRKLFINVKIHKSLFSHNLYYICQQSKHDFCFTAKMSKFIVEMTK